MTRLILSTAIATLILVATGGTQLLTSIPMYWDQLQTTLTSGRTK